MWRLPAPSASSSSAGSAPQCRTVARGRAPGDDGPPFRAYFSSGSRALLRRFPCGLAGLPSVPDRHLRIAAGRPGQRSESVGPDGAPDSGPHDRELSFAVESQGAGTVTAAVRSFLASDVRRLRSTDELGGCRGSARVDHRGRRRATGLGRSPGQWMIAVPRRPGRAACLEPLLYGCYAAGQLTV